ncbi:MAG: AMP-binding protein [Henriciella sp.]|nr:AMP-binding protein [Henriciella sp.]
MDKCFAKTTCENQWHPPAACLFILCHRFGKVGRNIWPAGEVGEICGTSPLLMPGYYKRPDLTEQAMMDGMLRTGDMGYVDDDGFLYLVDRKKDMIISGGVNVYPRDIEEIVVQHPAVKEVAVFGVPHPKWGETPVAAVTLMQGQSADPAELKDWINRRVGAKFQRVSAVDIHQDFPRNAAGKTWHGQPFDQFRPQRSEFVSDLSQQLNCLTAAMGVLRQDELDQPTAKRARLLDHLTTQLLATAIAAQRGKQRGFQLRLRGTKCMQQLGSTRGVPRITAVRSKLVANGCQRSVTVTLRQQSKGREQFLCELLVARPKRHNLANPRQGVFARSGQGRHAPLVLAIVIRVGQR